MLPTAQLLRHPQALAATSGFIALVGLALYLKLRRHVSPEQREEIRRNRLAAIGRIIDGTLIDSAPNSTAPEDAPPHALIYRYRIGGVTYECGQDVSRLAQHLPTHGGSLLGSPVQVRYDRDNPADSMIVGETWNGLWNGDQTHSDPHH